MEELSRLEQLILYILDYSRVKSIDSLTKYQLMKLVYLMEIEARKYTGDSFIEDLKYVRRERGPLSWDVQNSINELKEENYIEIEEVDIPEYREGAKRFSHRLKSGVTPKYTFDKSELLFINSVLEDYIAMDMRELKKVAYATEPMQDMLSKEKKDVDTDGAKIDFDLVKLDSDVLDLIDSDA